MEVWYRVQEQIDKINGQQFQIILNKKNKIDISKTLERNNITPYRGWLRLSAKARLQNAIYNGVRKSLKDIKKQKTDSLVAAKFIKDTISPALGDLNRVKNANKEDYDKNMQEKLKKHRLKIKQGPQFTDVYYLE
jgi:hypothetical protein